MNSKAAVLVALAIGLIVLTLPFWVALAARPDSPPELAKPVVDEDGNAVTVCVEKHMAARHMDILERWRKEVVRGKVEINGKVLETGDGASLEEPTKVSFRAIEPTELLFFDMAR